ncbi:MAG: hypothetical protein AB1646_16250 [Thermodesulfobacteriota bacterium]
MTLNRIGDTQVPATESVNAVAWYRPEQWHRLLEVSADRHELEDTWAEWYANATKFVLRMRSLGVKLLPFHVDVEELVRWCKERGLPIDGGSRSELVAQKIRHSRGIAESEESATDEHSVDFDRNQ